MKRLAGLLFGLLLLAPAVAQAQVLAYPSGVAGLSVNNCATAQRLLYLSSTNVTGCSTLSYDGTDVTLASGQILGTSGGVAATATQFSHADDANSGYGFLAADIPGIAAGGVWVFRGEVGKFGFRTGYPLVFRSGTNLDGDVVGIMDNAAGVLEINNGAAGTFRDLITRSISLNSATVSGSSPGITVGSGTGVTVNYAADVRTTTYKVTVAYTNCVAAAVTCDLTIATLPAKTYLKRVVADLTTTYACTATCTSTTLSATLGTSAGGNDLLASFDLDAAAAQFGDADAELGSGMNSAAVDVNGAKNVGVLFSWTGTTTLTYRITSGTGNLGNGSATNLSQGSVTFFLTTEVL